MSTLYVDNLQPNLGSRVMAAGHVVQVVTNTYSTRVVNSTASNVDTGLTASITPTSASSKILVTVSQHGLDKRTGNTYMELQLHADGSSIYQPNGQFLWTASTSTSTGSAVFSYLHSPSTTSSVTYKTVFRAPNGVAQVAVQYSGAESTITLMEIAQ